MKARTHKQDDLFIVYDADLIRHPGATLFDPAHWERQGAVAGKARGRGCAWFLETDFGAAVLKQYLRGGWAARVSRDRYVFSGFERSRPVREFRILEILNGAGLPAPEPLAALCRRDGGFYSGWILTRRIMDGEPLAEQLAARNSDRDLWRAVGACIRRFHSAGLVHADLNARNILVGPSGGVHLIDFDRSRISPGDERAFEANLARLRRSLEKTWPDQLDKNLESCWRLLRAGYAGDRKT